MPMLNVITWTPRYEIDEPKNLVVTLNIFLGNRLKFETVEMNASI